MKCQFCNRPIESDNDIKRELCFKCHVKGIRFNFVGVGYGQSTWNDSTIRETQQMYEAMPGVEKISTRQELI
jgi:hypothetical protein